ncbi:MAG TPA: adenylosuccinate synthetase [Candidatus Saccharimonadales bacterium]
MSLDVIVGLQRGDEGKGRFVDLMASQYDVIARANGGANAGHTIIPKAGQGHLALHQIPSGVAYPGKLNVIGNGVYLDPPALIEEMETVRHAGLEVSEKNLLISGAAHLVLPHHIMLDGLREAGSQAQGSTKSGIAYVAADKYLREGVRLESIYEPKLLAERVRDGLARVNDLLPAGKQLSKADLKKKAAAWLAATATLEPYLADTVTVVNDRLQDGQQVLAEGAQAFWLDINHGMYPAVTSSSTTVAGLLDGLGVSAKHLGKVTGVTKAVKSHVGGGPFVTEITDEKLAETVRGPLGKTDSEYGVTTKRPRRIGYPDLVELRNAILVNGVDELAISKLDHVPRYGAEVPVATSYTYRDKQRRTAPSSALALAACEPNYQRLKTWTEPLNDVRDYAKLPPAAAAFVELFATELNIPVTKIGVGANRSQVILR